MSVHVSGVDGESGLINDNPLLTRGNKSGGDHDAMPSSKSYQSIHAMNHNAMSKSPSMESKRSWKSPISSPRLRSM